MQGENFQRNRGNAEMRIERIPRGSTLVLPEICRVAAATDGVLPDDVEISWRVTPTTRVPTDLERCIDGAASRPFWVSAASVSDARLIARALPPASLWAAHLSRPTLPSPDEVATLREAGCGGLALPWSEALEQALATGGLEETLLPAGRGTEPRE